MTEFILIFLSIIILIVGTLILLHKSSLEDLHDQD
jgi:hypothetical protein